MTQAEDQLARLRQEAAAQTERLADGPALTRRFKSAYHYLP
jgi:hypothetical protein